MLEQIRSIIVRCFKVLWSILLSSRVKSLAWASATMLLAGVVQAVADNLQLFELSPGLTVFIGLCLAQITKALSNLREGKTAGFTS